MAINSNLSCIFTINNLAASCAEISYIIASADLQEEATSTIEILWGRGADSDYPFRACGMKNSAGTILNIGETGRRGASGLGVQVREQVVGGLGFILLGIGERPREFEEAAADRGIANRIVSVNEFDCFATPQRIGVKLLGRRLDGTGRNRLCVHRIRVIKEELHRHAEDPAQLMQAAGADSVGTALVFLDLLKGQPDRLAKLFLAPAEHVAAQPDPGTDLHVDGVWSARLFCARGLWLDCFSVIARSTTTPL